MKSFTLNLIISLIIICPPQLHAKQICCVVNVVDTMGRPIKDAEVSVWERIWDDVTAGVGVVEQLFPETKTDSEGDVCVRFEPTMSERSIFIFAQKAGFSVGWNGVFCPARIPKIRVVLGRPTVTAGIVTDEENHPIAGVKVTAYPINEVMVESALSHLNWPDSILTTTTDHEGRYSFNCLAEWMEVSFVAEHPGRARTDTTYNLQGERLKNYKAGTQDIRITMHPAGQIKGRILAKRGNTIEGVRLQARGDRIRNFHVFTAITDAEGAFSFNDLPSNDYLVTTVTENDDPAQQLTVGAITEVEVGQIVENVKIRMRDPIQLDVLVKDIKTNRPVKNASVCLSQCRPDGFASHVHYKATTDNRGIARVITLPGKCNISFKHENYDYSWGEYLIRSSDTNLVIGITPHSVVSGQVVYEDGRAASGVEVRASTFESEYKLTDTNGNFSIVFSESRAEKKFVIARDIKNGLAGLVDITDHEGDVKVVLNQAALLKGRVMDPENKPIENARVSVNYSVPYALTRADNDLYTDKDGYFELKAVPCAQEGFSHRVSLTAYQYSRIDYQKIEVNKEIGGIVELPPLVLKPCNMTLSGVAVYEDGSVAAHKSVFLRNVSHMYGQPQLDSVTDGEGKFHFDGICEGWLSIQCGTRKWGGQREDASQDPVGFITAKGGDRVTIIMNNIDESNQIHTTADSYQDKALPTYEELTKGIESEKLANKKILVCFWDIANEQSKKTVKQLTKISEELDKAGVMVVLLNCRPCRETDYISPSFIDRDKKWIEENNIPFIEADVPDMTDIMEIRRNMGAQFVPHMILTDENKIVTHEGFDVEWLKENAL